MMLPLMLSEGFHKRDIPLERIVEICSYNTANVHGLPNKGDVRVGYDGDLVIVDLNKKVRVSQDILHGRSDFTLYEGWEITGWPTMTILRGEVIAEEGDIVGKPGFGRVIRCIPHNLRKSYSQSSYA
jgi:dihydropyrimidinase